MAQHRLSVSHARGAVEVFPQIAFASHAICCKFPKKQNIFRLVYNARCSKSRGFKCWRKMGQNLPSATIDFCAFEQSKTMIFSAAAKNSK